MSYSTRLKDLIAKAIGKERAPQELAFSAALGFYIAFSPFPGAHMVMALACTWLFNLHFPILFLTMSTNNPWTMIPFYSFDYTFGYWIVHSVFNWEPTLIIPLAKVFGSGSICLWSFLIGGNALGIIFGLMSYLILRHMFTSMALKKQT